MAVSHISGSRLQRGVRTIRGSMILLVVAVISPLLLSTGYFLHQQVQIERSEGLREALDYARTAGIRVDGLLETLESVLTAAGAIVAEDLDAVEANDEKLQVLQAGQPRTLRAIWSATSDGAVLNSSNVPPQKRAGRSIADREYFRAALARGRFVLSAPTLSRVTGEQIVIGALPILDAVGAVRAVVATSVRQQLVHEVMAQDVLPAGASMAAFSERGVLIAQAFDAQPPLAAGARIADPLLERAAASGRLAHESVDSAGVRRYSAYVKIQRAPWIVHVAIPKQSPEVRARGHMLQLSLFAAVLLAVAVVLAYLLARRISRPIEAIEAGVRMAAAGRLDAQVPPSGPTEIASVAAEFNRMLAQTAMAQERLRESEAQFNAFMQASPAVAWIKDESLRYIYMNDAWEAAVGLKREDWIGKSLFDLAPREIAERITVMEREVLASGQALESIEDDLRMGGRVLNWNVILFMFVRASGQPCVGGIAIDLTARRQMEARLLHESARRRLLLHSAEDGIFVVDERFRVVESNPSFARMLGLRVEQVLRLQWWDFDAERPDKDALHAHWPQLPDTRQRLETRIRRRDGRIFDAELSGTPSEKGNSGTGSMLFICRDITERKRTEDALRGQAAHLRELSRRLLEVEETERRNINRELHDRIGQNLAALNLNVEILRAHLPPGAAASVAGRLDDAQALLQETSRHVRNLMADLRPAALDDYGLLAALRTYTAPYAARTGLAVDVEGEDLAPRLPLIRETALFRIAQEALNNIAKHARARRVVITLAETQRGIELVIADDGTGIDPSLRSGQGWGMATMRERAEAIDATLSVESSPGEGTRVKVVLERAQ